MGAGWGASLWRSYSCTVRRAEAAHASAGRRPSTESARGPAGSTGSTVGLQLYQGGSSVCVPERVREAETEFFQIQ